MPLNVVNPAIAGWMLGKRKKDQESLARSKPTREGHKKRKKGNKGWSRPVKEERKKAKVSRAMHDPFK